LKQLPLSERLYEAIREAQRITSHGGRRRQVHFVGKLMRDAPAEAIRQQLEEWSKGSRQQTAHMHRLEALRDRLLADDDALTELLAQHPEADSQHLRTLVRQGRKDRKSTRLNSSHVKISYAVFCLNKKLLSYQFFI